MEPLTKQLQIIGQARPLSFDLSGTEMVATDPCYEKGIWCQTKLENVRPGKWFSTVQYVDAGPAGIRVGQIYVWHALTGIGLEHLEQCNDFIGNIGVDSGQAGFFDYSQYPTDPGTYNHICELTLSQVPYKVLEETGAIVNSNTIPLSGEEQLWRESSNYEFSQKYAESQFQTLSRRNRNKMTDVLSVHGSLGYFGVLKFGCVSSTGYGDGAYSLYVIRAAGEIVAARIEFIPIEDDDDDANVYDDDELDELDWLDFDDDDDDED